MEREDVYYFTFVIWRPKTTNAMWNMFFHYACHCCHHCHRSDWLYVMCEDQIKIAYSRVECVYIKIIMPEYRAKVLLLNTFIFRIIIIPPPVAFLILFFFSFLLSSCCSCVLSCSLCVSTSTCCVCVREKENYTPFLKCRNDTAENSKWMYIHMNQAFRFATQQNVYTDEEKDYATHKYTA